jgi:hypothetical protein
VTTGDAPAPAHGAGADEGAHEDQRLRDVVRRLLTPTRAGFFLARDDLVRVGAVLGFPLPALDRRIMLEHLFLAVGPGGQLPRLLALLGTEADFWVGRYRQWEADYPDAAPIWADWRARAEALHADLVAMQALAEQDAAAESR